LENDMSISALCLNFVLANPWIDKAVIGVDSLDHLKENLANVCDAIKISKIKGDLENLGMDDENILMPSRWTKK